MESLSVLLLLLLLAAFFLHLFTARRPPNLPPCPPSLPIVGHLHLLSRPIHHNFHKISTKQGPIFSLRFRSRLAVVVSSLEIAEECFTKNDIHFADRPRLLFGKHLGYNYTTIATAPHGDHWRTLRRLAAVEIFSAARLNSSQSIRSHEIHRLLLKLKFHSKSNHDFAKVELKSMFSELIFNALMRIVAGKRDHGMEQAREFRKLILEISDHGGASNRADYLPILVRWVSGDGFEKNLVRLMKKAGEFVKWLIEDRRSKKSSEKQSNSLLDRLLDLQESEPEFYTDQIIEGLVLVLLLAGTDSSTLTLEWAMTQLLNNPEVLTRAKAELDTKVGQDRAIEEPDLASLGYLQAIVFETLRLHPAAPMLLPHYSSNDCTVAGYDIPRDTILLVNAWAIHRDPKLWDDPTSFRPERFLGAGNESQSSKVIAFGLGRRACPGATMALRFVGLTLGLLIQCYEWKRVEDVRIDMREVGGLTSHKLKPLEAMCKPRLVMDRGLLNVVHQI